MISSKTYGKLYEPALPQSCHMYLSVGRVMPGRLLPYTHGPGQLHMLVTKLTLIVCNK